MKGFGLAHKNYSTLRLPSSPTRPPSSLPRTQTQNPHIRGITGNTKNRMYILKAIFRYHNPVYNYGSDCLTATYFGGSVSNVAVNLLQLDQREHLAAPPSPRPEPMNREFQSGFAAIVLGLLTSTA